MLKENNRSSRILHLVNVSLKIKGERKKISDNRNWEDLSPTNTVKKKDQEFFRQKENYHKQQDRNAGRNEK